MVKNMKNTFHDNLIYFLLQKNVQYIDNINVEVGYRFNEYSSSMFVLKYWLIIQPK